MDIWLPELRAILSVGMEHKPGDPPPSGYNDWHEWAEVQHKAGLRQQKCCFCGLWNFPQELSGHQVVSYPQTSAGVPVRVVSEVCKECYTRPEIQADVARKQHR